MRAFEAEEIPTTVRGKQKQRGWMMALTDAPCRAAKKAEKPYKLSDSGGFL
jgi:hypothetical protein